MKYDLSILIPARNEMFTARTVQDIIEKKRGRTEVIVGLDGAWSDPGIEDHPDVRIVYQPIAIGQRAMTNKLARLSSAKYVMKVDAHCAFDEGFDVKLMEPMQDDWTTVPTMKNLHAFDWVCPDGHRRYQGPSGPCQECGKETTRDVIWYAKPSPNSTSYRFDKTLKFQYFGEYKAKQKGDLVESMSLQGSAFMLTRDKYWELNICDEQAGSWGHQGSEVALKTWLSGGRVIVNTRTWYAHMFRTQGGDFGFPWPAKEGEIEKARKHIRGTFLNDEWPLATHKLQWLVDKFGPVPDWHDGNNPSKAIIYYTDNQLDPDIMKACQDQLKKSGLPITSSALKKIDFGDRTIRFPSLKRSPYALFKQILGALENTPENIIFFCEHDVLYPPSHFDFTPPQKDTFYFNTNVWKVDSGSGKAVKVDRCDQLSGMVVWKEEALKFVREKMQQIENDGFDRHYEPRGKRETFSSTEPLVDIRHDKNMTPSRWAKEQFRNQANTEGWTEGECPDWAKAIFGEITQKLPRKIEVEAAAG
jgi:hypothetical protein